MPLCVPHILEFCYLLDIFKQSIIHRITMFVHQVCSVEGSCFPAKIIWEFKSHHWNKNIFSKTINPYAAGGYFGRYKMMQKSWKITETLANGYSSESTHQELSNEYQHDRVSMIFKKICFLMLWTKVASVLEGLWGTFQSERTKTLLHTQIDLQGFWRQVCG